MNDYCFEEKLASSLSKQDRVLALINGNIDGIKKVHVANAEQDKLGVDFIVEDVNGVFRTIDVKIREQSVKGRWKNGEPELTIETYSVCKSVRGWTFDLNKQCDYILYMFMPEDTDRAFFFNFHQLRRAAIKNEQEWIFRYGARRCRTGSYETECVFVPASIVQASVAAVGEWKA